MLNKYLKKNLPPKEYKKFFNQLKNSRTNKFGFFNPINIFYESDKEIIKFTENLLIERYLRFGFKKKDINLILKYLKKNKNQNPEISRKYINRNLLNFKGKYFEKIIKNYIPKRYSITLKYINKIVNLKKFKTIVDFGCGTNELGKNIAKDKSKKVIGMDVINYSEKFEQKNLRYIKMKNPNQIPVKKFDLLILNGVIHHIDLEHLDKFLNNLSQKMTQKSRVLLFEDSWTNDKFHVDKDLDKKNNIKFMNIQKKFSDFEIVKIYSFFDWIGNILTRNLLNISMPYNFNSLKDWEKIFARSGMVLEKKLNIGFFKNTLHRQGYVIMLFKKDKNKKIVKNSIDDFLKKYLSYLKK